MMNFLSLNVGTLRGEGQLKESPKTPLRASQGYYGLDFRLFRHLQRVFDLDA